MKKLKTMLIFVIPSCLLLFGCQNKDSEIEEPIRFSTIGGGIDGKGTQVIEWGEDIQSKDMYYSLGEGVNKKDCETKFEYDEDNVGKIIDMKFSIKYKDKDYKKIFTILIDDTKAPVIEYSGENRMKVQGSYDINKDLNVYDIKGKQKVDIKAYEQFSKFYPGYIITYAPVNDEEKIKDAKEGIMNQTLDIKYPGQYKVFIKASDGHGNITVNEIDMEVYKA